MCSRCWQQNKTYLKRTWPLAPNDQFTDDTLQWGRQWQSVMLSGPFIQDNAVPTPRSSAVHCWKITGENKLSLLKKWAFTTGVWGKHVASGAPRETSSPPDDASELARLPTMVWSVLNKWLCILSPSLYLLQGRTDLASLIIQSRYHEDQRSKEERLFSWLRFVQIYPMLSEGLRTSEGNFWVVYQ